MRVEEEIVNTFYNVILFFDIKGSSIYFKSFGYIDVFFIYHFNVNIIFCFYLHVKVELFFLLFG